MTKTPEEISAEETTQCGCCTEGRDTSLYGGQAVIEGVLMKGKHRAVVACRNAKGEIVSKVLFNDPDGHSAIGIRRIPFLRGFFILWDSLSLGIRALSFSADVAMMEEDQAGKDEPPDEPAADGGNGE